MRSVTGAKPLQVHFSSKRADFVLEDRRTGEVMGIVELDDSTHDQKKDIDQDRLLARAGYKTVRLKPGRHSYETVAQALSAFGSA